MTIEELDKLTDLMWTEDNREGTRFITIVDDPLEFMGVFFILKNKYDNASIGLSWLENTGQISIDKQETK